MFGGYMMGGLGRWFGGYYPCGYGTWFGGGLTNILFLILIGVVIYLLVKQIRNVNFFKKHDTDVGSG
jgi:putative membrane protein